MHFLFFNFFNMTLLELLSQSKRTEFKFVNLQKDYAESDGSIVAILTLAEPIQEVTGSQSVTDGVNSERVTAFDVTQVKIHQSEMSDDGITVNPDKKSGTVSTDLRLDVAKSTGEVWLTSKSFASMGREMRQEKQMTRRESLLDQIKARREQATKVSPVASAPKAEAQKVQPVVTK
jgi:hypothetical protein